MNTPDPWAPGPADDARIARDSRRWGELEGEARRKAEAVDPDPGPCEAKGCDGRLRPEWQAEAPWHAGFEARTACARCGIRRARIVCGPVTAVLEGRADPDGVYWLSGADSWPDDPAGEGPD